MQTLSCMWALVPWSGIEPGAPALGARSLSHWTTREVPLHVFSHLGSSFVIPLLLTVWTHILFLLCSTLPVAPCWWTLGWLQGLAVTAILPLKPQGGALRPKGTCICHSVSSLGLCHRYTFWLLRKMCLCISYILNQKQVWKIALS